MSKQFPKLKYKAILAPMFNITDVAFRTLCKKYKAGLTTTEFVSVDSVIHNNPKTEEMLKTDKIEKPNCVQIFGEDKKKILQACYILEKKFDIIDFNLGCSDERIIKCNSGSELLKYPNKIKSIISEMSSTTNSLITAKIRKLPNDKDSIKIASIIQNSGASAITIHGRTQKQRYDKKADWKIIKKIKENLSIPVIGNGDISSPENFKEKLEYSNVDYIMIGRAVIGNPCLFVQINDYLFNGEYKKEENKFCEYLKLARKYKLPLKNIKNQSLYFTKGIENASKIRRELSASKDIKEIEKTIKIYFS